jgi:hypothetical protein
MFFTVFYNFNSALIFYLIPQQFAANSLIYDVGTASIELDFIAG